MSDKIFNSRLADKFVVRLDDGMRDKIQFIAKESGRSMNSEIKLIIKQRIDRFDNGEVEIYDSPAVLAEAVDAPTWSPRVGDLVRRIDTKRILGTIARFDMSASAGLTAKIYSLNSDAEEQPQPVALLTPVDISEIIADATAPVRRALNRIGKGQKA